MTSCTSVRVRLHWQVHSPDETRRRSWTRLASSKLGAVDPNAAPLSASGGDVARSTLQDSIAYLPLPSTLSQLPLTSFAGAFLTSLAVMPVISDSALGATSLSL